MYSDDTSSDLLPKGFKKKGKKQRKKRTMFKREIVARQTIAINFDSSLRVADYCSIHVLVKIKKTRRNYSMVDCVKMSSFEHERS